MSYSKSNTDYGLNILASKIARGIYVDLADKVQERVYEILKAEIKSLVKEEALKIADIKVSSHRDLLNLQDMVRVVVELKGEERFDVQHHPV